MFEYLFIGFVVLGIFLDLRVRFLLKKYYPEKYHRIFGESWTQHSIATSLNFARFSLRKGEWSGIDDKQVLVWLKVSKVFSIAFYGVGIFAVFYVLYKVIREIFF